jgi:hypothetical protein
MPILYDPAGSAERTYEKVEDFPRHLSSLRQANPNAGAAELKELMFF